ncbi:MAG: hypothetical protein HRU31_16600, partial [Rhodobacteraceae bacterium]|nr:hypothetical protein [Paracoccaceae bacterium]
AIAIGLPGFATTNGVQHNDWITGQVPPGAGLNGNVYHLQELRDRTNGSVDRQDNWRGMSGAAQLCRERANGARAEKEFSVLHIFFIIKK